MKYIYITVLLCLIYSCNLKQKSDSITKTPVHIINELIISDTTYTNINNLLTLEEYIVLDKEVPLADINRVIVTEKQIFIFDSEPKVVCYNRKGEIEYKISNRGKGVGEFIKIVDFSVDKKVQLLKIYDSTLRKILCYDINNGKFKYDRKIDLSPHAIANFNGYDYYYNPYHYNYPDSKDYHYSLIKSRGEKDIVNKLFAHDPILSNYMFGASGESPFFYGKDELLYINDFGKTVYSLSNEGVVALLEIELPNAVPYSYIKNKPKPIDLIQSTYSSGITDIYRVDNILYFTFTNEGYFISTFYDLELNKLVYCGKRVWPEPTKKLPVYYPIRGVYENRFFSVINPSAVVELREKNKKVFSQEMLNINEMDNPVIAFYSVNNEK